MKTLQKKQSAGMLKKTVVVVALGIAVFTLGAKPTFAAENIFQRVRHSVTSKLDSFYLHWIPGKKSGKLVLNEMNNSYQTLKSFESETTIEANATKAGQPVGSAKISAMGPTKVGEIWDTKSYQQDMTLNGSVTMEGTSLSAVANIKMVDGVTYVMISQLPSIPGVPVDLSALKNSWIKIDPAASPTGTPAMEKPTADQQQRMQAAFEKMLASSQVGDAQPETKDGESTYKVDITVSKSALIDYLIEVGEIQKEMIKKNPDTEAMTPEPPTKEEMKANYESTLAAVGDIKATLWVEKSHYYPTYFELPLELDAAKVAEKNPSLVSATDSFDKVSIKITSDIRKFNESFDIKAPETSEDIQTIMQKVLGGMGAPSGAMAPTPTSSLKVRKPTLGTSELPEMTPAQLEQYKLYENR